MDSPTYASDVHSSKRVKLDTYVDEDGIAANDPGEELDGDHCSICLQLLLDRTVIPECSHEFCFECIVTWSEQSRRCPLCTRTIGPYLIHHIRSNFDFQKYHLPPLRSSPPPIQPLRRLGPSTQRSSGRERRWGRRGRREQDVADELERAIDRRRWIYHNHLYAKHVGSNRTSRYRPFPTPAQFSASQDYISRATIFIRRELRVWPNLDVEFLTTFILSLMKAIDIRSESAIKLLAEFLDMDYSYREGRRFPNAEHFAHELYSFLRSPFKTLSAYDVNVQYDEPRDANTCVDNDTRSVPDMRTVNEISPPRSGIGRYNGARPMLLDGSGPSWPNLNTRGANDRLDRSSSFPSFFPDVEKSGTRRKRRDEGPSATPSSDENSPVPPKPAISFGMLKEGPSGDNDSTPNEHPISYGQGGSVEDTGREMPEDLATRSGHMGDHILNQLSQNDEVEVRQPSGNASVDAEKHEYPKQGNPSSRQSSYQNSTQATGVLRIRNPLLIAQAHLSHLSEGRDKRKLDQQPIPPTRNDRSPSDLLRRSSHSDTSNRPSLLSRISEVQTNGSATEISEGGAEGSLTEDKPIDPVSVELLVKLLHRSETESATQAEQEQGDPSVTPLTPQRTSVVTPHSAMPNTVGSSSSVGPVQGRQIADLEVKARARARLKMKLTIEKHLHSSSTHLGNVEVHNSEDESTRKNNREGMLRAVLENRRRGG